MHFLIYSLSIVLIQQTSEIEGLKNPKYVYNMLANRTVPLIPYLRQAPWEVRGFTGRPPFVPNKFLQTMPELLKVKPGEDCAAYLHMERGHFVNTADQDKIQWRYGWKAYHKNCDIRKFLVCNRNKCNCMPGMYWDHDVGTCVVRLGGNCTSVKGFDFRFYRECGETMICRTRNSTRVCVCKYTDNEARNLVPPERDEFGNRIVQCKRIGEPDYESIKHFGDKCEEYQVDITTGNPAVRTSCGDIPGTGRNMFCRFEASQLNRTKARPRRPRVNGTCACLRSNLRYIATPNKTGCFLPVGGACNVTIRGKDLECEPELGLLCDKNTSKCVCSDAKVEVPSGFCERLGAKVTLGANCNVTIPCDEDKNLICVKIANSSKCACKLGYSQDKDFPTGCRKIILYGSPCSFASDCPSADTFECVSLDELNSNAEPKKAPVYNFKRKSIVIGVEQTGGQKYCVCQPDAKKFIYVILGNYLSRKTRTCGSISHLPFPTLLILLGSIVRLLKLLEN